MLIRRLPRDFEPSETGCCSLTPTTLRCSGSARTLADGICRASLDDRAARLKHRRKGVGPNAVRSAAVPARIIVESEGDRVVGHCRVEEAVPRRLESPVADLHRSVGLVRAVCVVADREAGQLLIGLLESRSDHHDVEPLDWAQRGARFA